MPNLKTMAQGAQQGGMIVHQVLTDAMEPALKRRKSVVYAEPCRSYDYEGLFLIEVQPDAFCVYRAQGIGGGQIRLSLDSDKYGPPRNVHRTAFSSMVRGRVRYVVTELD